jgi:hypothetical protein
MEVKKCNICWATKEITLFPSNWVRKGIKTYKPFCKYCKKIMRNNELRDKIIIVRWNPVVIPNELRIKKLEYQKAYRERNKEILKEKAQEYFKKVYTDPERKKLILRRNRKSYHKNKFI